MMEIGLLHVFSIILLTAVVAVVYSAAQEAYAPARDVARQAVRRGLKLAGVLAGLALIVHFLSHF